MTKQTETQIKAKTFLNPEALLKTVPLEPAMVVADFGCGNGHYAAAAGSLVGAKGQVYALDILDEALSQTATLAKLMGINNVSTRQCDLETFGGCGLPETSCDVVIISSILHQVKKKDSVLREAYRILKTNGKILVVDWQKDSSFGPVPAERVSKEEARVLLEKSSYRPVADLPAGNFHYALLYAK